MNLNEQLKYYRMQNGKTQQEMADILNVDKSTYAHYESGRRTPNAKTWVEITRILKIPVFPAEITVTYPVGTLDEFENCLNEFGTPISNNYHDNISNAEKIHIALSKVLNVRGNALDTSALPVEQLNDLPMPQTVANVTLDLRGESLISRAIFCYDALLKASGIMK